MLLLILLSAGFAYLGISLAALCRAKKENKPSLKSVTMNCLKAGAIPGIVTLTMTYLFIIVGGSRTVQLNTGSSSAMSVWSTWCDLWPCFVLLTLLNTIGTLVWTLKVCFGDEKRKIRLPIALGSLVFSTLVLLAVVSFFPSV